MVGIISSIIVLLDLEDNMEIIKQLNLNKTPKDVKNGSIVCAKNMMIDDTGSFLTNENGLKVSFECPNETEFIVGCIPCNSEIVIFTYERNNGKSRIYRQKNDYSVIEVYNNWTYNGGTITGTYSYNYKGELIIAVSEYDARTIEGKPLRVPLKSWNLDSNNESLSYNIEEIIPKFDAKYTIGNDGSLVCGVYTFFIRFQVDEATYTKWFQLTDDIIILNLVEKEKPKHTFLNGAGTATTEAVVKGFEEGGKSVFFINDNLISSNNILIDLHFIDTINYSNCQIAYIIKRNEEVLGRIENTYKVTNSVINIVDNKYSEEIAIDELLKEPHQFYNVKNIVNYNNRLYISNYEEEELENLQTFADKILSGITLKNATGVNETLDKSYLNVTFNAMSEETSNIYRQISYYKNNDKMYISNPKVFVKQLMELIAINGNPITKVNDIYSTDENDVWSHLLLYQYFYVFSSDDMYCIYGTDGTPNDYDIRIDSFNNDGNNINYLTIIDKQSKKEYPLYTNDTLKGTCDVLGKMIYYNKPYLKGKNPNELPYYIIGPTVSIGQWADNSSPSFEWNHGINNPNKTFSIFTTVEEVTKQYVIKSDVKYNNNRTLIPGQVYNFYIHYIRPNMSSTNGFKLKVNNISTEYNLKFINFKSDNNESLFLVPSINQDERRLIHPVFKNVQIPKGYIGYFFTYENIEQTAYPVCITKKQDSGIAEITNTSFIYDDRQIAGTKYTSAYKGVYVNNASLDIKVEHKNKLREPYIEVKPFIDENREIIITDNHSIYKKEVKTLYRLTKNIYTELEQTDVDSAYMFLPGFWNNEKVIHYDTDIIAAPTATNVVNKDGGKTSYTITLDSGLNYSNQPLNAYSIKQDYNKGSVSLSDTSGKALGVVYNSVLTPDRLTDFLQIAKGYVTEPSKSYTNYSKNNIDTFNNTIYRSNVISDESLVNGFREFEFDNYKNIVENKGKIVNIIGIGLYLIIHTEYSIFVFDRTPKLTIKSQLEIPDVFSIDYQELLPANEGFGGLIDKNESIISKNGYIWFDKTNKIIFRYENGKINTISSDINNLLKAINIDTIRFAEDTINNRLLICIYLKEADDNGNVLSLTLSYNFNSNTFISLHDYTFTNNYKTYNKSYIFDENKDRKRLYEFAKESNTYCNLKNNNTTIYPKYE